MLRNKYIPFALIQQCGIWLLLGIAFLLRLPLLSGSFWLDEAAQALEVIRPLHQQFNIIEDFQPPLLHVYLFLVQHISHAEWWLRLWGAVIPSIASIFLTYKIGQKLKNTNVGILSAILLATSSFHIFYSQELRPYALPAFLATLSWWLLLEKLSDKKNLTNKFFLGFSIITFFGLYSSYLYPFLLLSQLAYVFLSKKRYLRPTIFSFGLAVIGFLPWLPILSMQLAAGEAVRRAIPGWDQVVSIPQAKSILLVVGKFIFGVVNIEINFWFITITSVVVGLCAFLLWQHKHKTNDAFNVILVWLIVPVVSSWFFSFFIPVVQPKRLLFLLPAFYLFVANLIISNITKTHKIQQIAATILFGTLFLSNCASTLKYYSKPEYQRENWRALQQEITQRFDPTTTILVFAFPEPFAPWIWYDQHAFPTLTTGRLNTSLAPDITTTFKKATDYEFVLVFDYLRDLTDPDNKIPATLNSFGYEERGVLDYPQIGFIRIYARTGSATASTSLQ